MNQDKYNTQSKDRLSRIVSTKIRNVFVGALAAFENSKFMDLVRSDKNFYHEYQSLRAKILDCGNDQIRELKKEFTLYKISMQRYHYKMPVLKTKEEYIAYRKGLEDAKKQRNTEN